MRQLRIMWGVCVGASIEVLVAPDCEHGAMLSTNPHTNATPMPALTLIEHWNFSISHNRWEIVSSNGKLGCV